MFTDMRPIENPNFRLLSDQVPDGSSSSKYKLFRLSIKQPDYLPLSASLFAITIALHRPEQAMNSTGNLPTHAQW